MVYYYILIMSRVKDCNKVAGEKDKYYTPRWAVESIIKYIPKDKVIWESCCGQQHISSVLESYGYKVISTDIEMGDVYDFMTYEPEEHYDIIITNPPFSIKTEVIKRCYELNKPFMLLLPNGTMESIKRINMFKEHGITCFQFTRRVQYVSTYTTKRPSAPFYSLWYGWNVWGTEHNRIYFLEDEEYYMKWKKNEDVFWKSKREHKKLLKKVMIELLNNNKD